jgi:hypothetical protein
MCSICRGVMMDTAMSAKFIGCLWPVADIDSLVTTSAERTFITPHMIEPDMFEPDGDYGNAQTCTEVFELHRVHLYNGYFELRAKRFCRFAE